MMKFLSLLPLVFALNVNAQKEKTEQYIQQYSELAIQEMIRTGVPAAIKLAQGILESQSGESDLVKRSNNHFGIKCKTEWTGDKTYHDDDEKGECFRVYPDATASYKDHSDFLKTRSHYNFLFKLDPTNYEAWANGLKKAGYATSPAYPKSLIKVIKDFQLDRFNQIALERSAVLAKNYTPASAPGIAPKQEPTKPVQRNEAKKQRETITTVVVEETITDDPEEEEEAVTTTKAETTTTVSDPVSVAAPKQETTVKKLSAYPEGIFRINQCKVIYANAGISLLALAQEYNITLSKLLEYNEMSNVDILEQDQLIFLEKKQKRGSSDYHVVRQGENLYSIVQTEGVRLENILQYNNISKESTPAPGNKIYLKAILTAKASPNKK
ncbi:MAG: glucosaminidase domain-containing protein [Sediminibacterium sp.]|nr:glucosaminidase domain-containing protein [Sediminibacterium sp.]